MRDDFQVSQSSLLPTSMTLGTLPVTSSSPVPTSPADAFSKEDDAGLRMTPSSSASDKMAFLLLSQEEFLEHNSKVTHCRFSSSGAVIASSDLDGVLKVEKHHIFVPLFFFFTFTNWCQIWSPTPNPQTKATFIAKTPITALEWVPESDRHFLYGTRDGIVRICDQIDRRTLKEVNFGSENRIIRTLACNDSSSHCAMSTSSGNLIRLND